MKSEFTISHKKRLQDSVFIYGSYYKVSTLIESNPMLLWNAIHNNSYKQKGKALSLVRPAYDLLKKAVSKIAPEEVAKVEEKFEHHKQNRKKYSLVKKLQQEIKTGKINTSNSSFKKL